MEYFPKLIKEKKRERMVIMLLVTERERERERERESSIKLYNLEIDRVIRNNDLSSVE